MTTRTLFTRGWSKNVVIGDLIAQDESRSNIRSTYCSLIWSSPEQTKSQILGCDRLYRVLYINSYKRQKILSVVNNIRYRLPPWYNLERLKLPEVATDNTQSLEAALPYEGELTKAPLKDCWWSNKVDLKNAAECDKNRRNDWFDEDCQAVLDESNAAPAMKRTYIFGIRSAAWKSWSNCIVLRIRKSSTGNSTYPVKASSRDMSR